MAKGIERRKTKKTRKSEKKWGYKDKNTIPKLWTIKQPDDLRFRCDGQVDLFHFTKKDNLVDILKYGIIFGDIIINQLEGFNAPNLTSESQFHDPGHRSKPLYESETKNDYNIRLTIRCDAEKKIINYGWFDKTYCGSLHRNMNRRLEGIKSTYFGDIDKQYIYKRHITPDMIESIYTWNEENQDWVSMTQQDINDICKKYKDLPSKPRTGIRQLRVTGLVFNDYTGMVKTYFVENDYKETYQHLYKYSDYICDNLTGTSLRKYRKKAFYFLHREMIEELIYFIMKRYNVMVQSEYRIDLEKEMVELQKRINLSH